MACNHKHNEVIATGVWDRKQPDIVQEDKAVIYQCLKCMAIRIDFQNEYVLEKGKWSKGRN